MKKEYSTPELETVSFSIRSNILALSDPEPYLPTEGGGNNPGDGFDEL